MTHIRRYYNYLITAVSKFRPQKSRVVIPVILTDCELDRQYPARERLNYIYDYIKNKIESIEILSINDNPHLVIRHYTQHKSELLFRLLIKTLKHIKSKQCTIELIIAINRPISDEDCHILRSAYLKTLRSQSSISLLIIKPLLTPSIRNYCYISQQESDKTQIKFNEPISRISTLQKIILDSFQHMQSDINRNMLYYLTEIESHYDRICFYRVNEDLAKLQSEITSTLKRLFPRGFFLKKIIFSSLYLGKIPQTHKHHIQAEVTHDHQILYKSVVIILLVFCIIISCLVPFTEYRSSQTLNRLDYVADSDLSINTPFQLSRLVIHSALPYLLSFHNLKKYMNLYENKLVDSIVKPYLFKNIPDHSDPNRVASLLHSETDSIMQHLNYNLDRDPLIKILNDIPAPTHEIYIPIFLPSLTTHFISYYLVSDRHLVHLFQLQRDNYNHNYFHTTISPIQSIPLLYRILETRYQLPFNITHNHYVDTLNQYKQLKKLINTPLPYNIIALHLRKLLLFNASDIANSAYFNQMDPKSFNTNYLKPLRAFHLSSNYSELVLHNASQHPSVMLTPISLSSNSQRVIFTVDNKSIIYNHGPETSYSLSLGTTHQCRMTFYDSSTAQTTSFFDTKKCLAELFKQSQMERHQDQIFMTYRKRGHYLTLLLSIEDYEKIRQYSRNVHHFIIGDTYESAHNNQL